MNGSWRFSRGGIKAGEAQGCCSGRQTVLSSEELALKHVVHLSAAVPEHLRVLFLIHCTAAHPHLLMFVATILPATHNSYKLGNEKKSNKPSEILNRLLTQSSRS